MRQQRNHRIQTEDPFERHQREIRKAMHNDKLTDQQKMEIIVLQTHGIESKAQL